MKIREIIVSSGKGGTGKTSVLGSFAALAEGAVLADCDVDAADLHLLLAPEVKSTVEFKSGFKASINLEKCVACGKCRELCRFDAIREDCVVDRFACEGCGVCHHFCPEGAVNMDLNKAGEYYISDSRFGPVVHARLMPGEGNSGKLVSAVRGEARNIAKKEGRGLLLVDGSPGVGCAVIASITGADLVVLVTEPTMSGMHDMTRVLDLADHFQIPARIIVNKHDLNPEMTAKIVAFANDRGAGVAGCIPFNPDFVKAMVDGKSIVEYNGSSEKDNMVGIWNGILMAVDKED